MCRGIGGVVDDVADAESSVCSGPEVLNSYNAVANLLYWHQGGGHNSRDLVAILVIRPIAREALLPSGAEGLDDDGEWLVRRVVSKKRMALANHSRA